MRILNLYGIEANFCGLQRGIKGVIYTSYIYKGKSSIEVFANVIETKDVPNDVKLTRKMCREGCKNHGIKMGCPPRCPDWPDLVGKYPWAISIAQKWIPKEPGIWTGTKALRLMAICTYYMTYQAMYGRLAGRWIQTQEKTIKFLSSGHCSLCMPCLMKKSLPCVHPNDHLTSMEATGILCEKLCEKLFGFGLQWIDWKSLTVPDYWVMTYMVLLCEQPNESSVQNVVEGLFPKDRYGLVDIK